MQYTAPAMTGRPALIIYVIDTSDTMLKPFHSGQSRIDVVNSALQEMLRELTQRSMKGSIVAARYHIAVFTYSDQVVDLLGTKSRGRSIWPLKELLEEGIPPSHIGGRTNTYAAFAAVDALLERELATETYTNSPAPLICHFTDGGYSTDDPTPIIQRIRKRAVKDGAVLVENVYVAEDILAQSLREADLSAWPGITQANDLTNPYARFLFKLSSPLPEHHRLFLKTRGYALSEKAALFFPGSHIDIIRLAFAASAATG